MTPDEFKQLDDPAEVAELSLPLQALWADARGDWDEAHNLCQRARNRDGDWVHAYLHRKEGDEGNAWYWYSEAGRATPPEGMSPEAEWTVIATELLG
ncbi:MAG: hypothetical protein ABII82_00060 [Verrucomicrobiota bacterium]